jgi:hypothetical protein
MSPTILTFDRNRPRAISSGQLTMPDQGAPGYRVPPSLLGLVEDLEIVADIQPKMLAKIQRMTQAAIAEHADRVDPVSRPVRRARRSGGAR